VIILMFHLFSFFFSSLTLHWIPLNHSSSVQWLTAGWKTVVQIMPQVEIFLLSDMSVLTPEPPSLLSRGSLQLGHEAHVTNVWSYAPDFSRVFMAWWLIKRWTALSSGSCKYHVLLVTQHIS
jgi:hypothetical protein